MHVGGISGYVGVGEGKEGTVEEEGAGGTSRYTVVARGTARLQVEVGKRAAETGVWGRCMVGRSVRVVVYFHEGRRKTFGRSLRKCLGGRSPSI
jgi:hypothetical protein